MAHRARAQALLLVALAGCSLALDFDDLEGLPCPCTSDAFVCLEQSNRCVPTRSVDPYKSCAQDTPLRGDELCPDGHVCAAVNGLGPRCLPRCQPVSYARPTAGRTIAAQCPLFGTTCWPSSKGGVCSEGVCRDNPNSCPPQERCVLFNGAGVCFTECRILQTAPLPCGAGEACHPIGLADVTACVATGNIPSGGVCTRDEDGMCEQLEAGTGRPLICARPEASSNDQLFCRPVCNAADATGCVAGETCPLVRANVDPFTGLDIGVCTGA